VPPKKTNLVLRKRTVALLAISLVALPAFAAPPTGGNLQYEAIPLERTPGNHLLAHVEINGKPAVLTIDSGAPISAIAVNRREHFEVTPVTAKSKLPPRLDVNGVLNFVGITKSFRLGALVLVDEPVVMLNLERLRGRSSAGGEGRIDGILGADILLPLKAIVDCERQLLLLKIDPRIPGAIPGVDLRGYRGVRMHLSEGLNFYVDGSVNKKKVKLMVDTGAVTTSLHLGLMRRMGIPLRKTRYVAASVNLKESRVQLATIAHFSVGPLDMQSHDVTVFNLEDLIHGGLLDGTPPVAGLLGLGTLRRYHGIIDFGRQTLYLKQ
jgi:predicted aspartyl protease